MALLNPSFDDEGALPGEAAHWTLTAVTSSQVLAGFGIAPELAWEDFERWFELSDEIASVTTARGFFNGARDGFEPFEHGWSLGVYLWELPPAQTVPATFGPDDVETCEKGWRNAPFFLDWSEPASTTGQFNGEPREDFEDAWRTNEAFAWSWPSVASVAAAFDGGTQSVEDFNDGWTHAVTQ